MGQPGVNIAFRLSLSDEPERRIAPSILQKRRHMQASLLTELGKLPEYRELIANFTLREIKLAHCIGCFGCWVETPGLCV